ncbi:MAG: hypothetical protein ACI82I_003302 [Gammaproteobacteria bacterium]
MVGIGRSWPRSKRFATRLWGMIKNLNTFPHHY